MQEPSSKDNGKVQDFLEFVCLTCSQDSQRGTKWRGGKYEHERELNVQSKWDPTQ